MTRTTRRLTFKTEADTAAFAEQLALVARRGDCFLLSGDIGAGKSTLARAFIRARLSNPSEEVPSPTYTLVQTYPHNSGDIWHCDLYRTTDPSECLELGLDEAFANAICLIEWPERLGAYGPDDAINIQLSAGENQHTAEITVPTDQFQRVESAFD